ncbi:hypothetical protein AVEN_114118-1 [Araneus ventricosus]|uniref:Uncharacterized protein n=1 Tax=Araneus ventricosus TaxID=182803 RepID=A0A4Y2VTI0_ARAVE|nr:hypothetical protein AVEN_114118-1 [Araneus ventricosus]
MITVNALAERTSANNTKMTDMIPRRLSGHDVTAQTNKSLAPNAVKDNVFGQIPRRLSVHDKRVNDPAALSSPIIILSLGSIPLKWEVSEINWWPHVNSALTSRSA